MQTMNWGTLVGNGVQPARRGLTGSPSRRPYRYRHRSNLAPHVLVAQLPARTTPTSSPRPARRRWRVRRRCPRFPTCPAPALRSSPLPPPLCCSTTPTVTMRHPTLLPASSSFSQFLLGCFRSPSPGPGAFLANRNHCRAHDTPPYGPLFTANLHTTESLRALTRYVSTLSLTPTSAAPCAYAPCPSASTDIDAASAPAIHICTDLV
ncbi:hypothetical protein K438DRAFT_372717 [Mycena galopus ATCC 62051]|nr:hypothetical protein K438DRAFT_372717 [Mycena galopus ATCC 62051]